MKSEIALLDHRQLSQGPNRILGIYIAIVSAVMLGYSVITAIQYL